KRGGGKAVKKSLPARKLRVAGGDLALFRWLSGARGGYGFSPLHAGGAVARTQDARLRRYGFGVLKLAVLDGDDDGGLGGVAILVDGGLAGDAFEILRPRQSFAQPRAVRRAGPLDGVGQDIDGVVTEGGHRVRDFVVVLRLEFRHELLHGRGGILRRVVRRIIGAFHRGASDGQQLRRLPAIPAKDGHLDAELAGLHDDQRRFGVITRHEYPLRVR